MDQAAEIDAGPGPGERGRELERRVADYFATQGYEVQRNVVAEGRSGARHEVDVLAVHSDDAVTLSLAIECKAWAEPVATEPVARLDWLMRDLALNKGVLVCPAGATPAATETARDLGIEIWGADEVQTRLGAPPPAAPSSAPKGLAWPMVIDGARAQRVVNRESGGILGLGRESIRAQGACWLGWHALEFVETMEEGLIRRRLRTQRHWLLYDSIAGDVVRPIDDDPDTSLPRVHLEGRRLPISTTAERIVGAIQQAASRRDAVVSDNARERHGDRLEALGLARDGEAPNVERRRLVWQPLWVAVLDRGGRERAVVVDLAAGGRDEELEEFLTGRIREIVGALGVTA